MSLDRPSTLRTPLSLLLRLARGNDDDWRTFYGIYGPLVYRLARNEGLADPDADDVLARVMRSLFQRLQSGFQVDPDKGQFRSYVATATRHAVVAQRRGLEAAAPSAEMTEQVPDDGPSPSDHLSRMERVERLRLCLERLRESADVRPRDMQAFEAYALRGEPAERVARMYGITRERLYGLKSEMLERIRKMMSKLDIELGEV